MTRKIREDLASAYQILAKLGMDDHTYTHLSAREKSSDYYYILPFGHRFEEITADNLLKVSLEGEILEGFEQHYNKTGYVIHSNIYKSRPELNSIFHLHTVSTVAVSAMKEGLLPISQWALHFYEKLAYHQYDSLALDDTKHGADISKDLGNKMVMFLRNHGFIACGLTIAESLYYSYHLELACKSQIAALSSGRELVIPDHETCLKSNSDLLSFEKNLGERDWKAWLRFLGK